MSANRIIDVSNPAHLRTANKQLAIEQESRVAATFPIGDLEVILLSHPQITASIGLMQQCLESKVPIIVCDQKHMPKGYLFNPLAHTLHSKVLKLQAGASLPLKKQNLGHSSPGKNQWPVLCPIYKRQARWGTKPTSR